MRQCHAFKGLAACVVYTAPHSFLALCLVSQWLPVLLYRMYKPL